MTFPRITVGVKRLEGVVPVKCMRYLIEWRSGVWKCRMDYEEYPEMKIDYLRWCVKVK